MCPTERAQRKAQQSHIDEHCPQAELKSAGHGGIVAGPVANSKIFAIRMAYYPHSLLLDSCGGICSISDFASPAMDSFRPPSKDAPPQ